MLCVVCCMHVASMRSTAVLLTIAALFVRISAYRLHTFPRTSSKAASRFRLESCSRTSSRRGNNLDDKIDDAAASRTQLNIATGPSATLTNFRQKTGMVMSIFSRCLDYARECPQLVVGALCTTAATAGFLSSCGDQRRRFETLLTVSSVCIAQHTSQWKLTSASIWCDEVHSSTTHRHSCADGLYLAMMRQQ